MLIVKQASQDVGDKVGDKVEELEAQGRKAVRKASPWIVRLGRIGLVAKGLVYVILGWLAIQAAFYRQGELTDQRGRCESVLRQPFGAVLLGVMCFGLFAYMVWRMVQALFNPEREPQTFGGWSKRIFRFGSGIIYGGLGVAAARLLVGMQAHRRTPSDWTAMVMRWPLGKWLVVAAGLAIVGYGMFRIYKAWQGELKKQLVLDAYAARAAAGSPASAGSARRRAASCSSSWASFAFFAGLHTNPERSQGHRRSARVHRTRAVRPVPPRRRGGGAHRVRVVPVRRSALPPDQRGVGAIRLPRAGRSRSPSRASRCG